MASTTQNVFLKRDKRVNFHLRFSSNLLVANPLICTKGTPSNHPRGNEPLTQVDYATFSCHIN